MLVRVILRKVGHQECAPERGEHVSDRDCLLAAISRRAGAVGREIRGGPAVQRIPDDRQAVAGQSEGHDAFHAAAGAGARLHDPARWRAWRKQVSIDHLAA